MHVSKQEFMPETLKKEILTMKQTNRRSKRENFDKGFPNQQETQVLTMPSHQQQLLKIETCVLKVNLNCHRCRRKVQKILRKIEGVYSVSIDAEQHRVIVKGIVDSSTLIKKPIRSGKHAEVWSQKSNQKNVNQQQHYQNKLRNNLLGVGPFEGGNQNMDLDVKELENLLKGISGNAFSGEGNYPNDINSMMQILGINEHPNNHQGYDFGGPVKNNFQQFQNYPAGLTAYGYQNPPPAMMANLMGNQYNQNPYAGWLRANPQNMQGIMNNKMLDGYLNM